MILSFRGDPIGPARWAKEESDCGDASAPKAQKIESKSVFRRSDVAIPEGFQKPHTPRSDERDPPGLAERLKASLVQREVAKPKALTEGLPYW